MGMNAPDEPKKHMTGSEVRRIFSEARQRRLANPFVLTKEMVRKQQETMKSPASHSSLAKAD